MIEPLLRKSEEKMRTSVEAFKKDLATIRTGRASPALIEHVRMDYAGVPTPLNQVAGISAPEPRLLVIQPWDKGTIRDIEKALLKSDLGLNPTSDGNIIRLVIPPLSEERRQELTKIVHKRVEERKIAVRNIRHETLEELRKMEKSKEISQDQEKRAIDLLQKLTDKYILEVEKIGKAKETELMEV